MAKDGAAVGMNLDIEPRHWTSGAKATQQQRAAAWQAAVDANGGMHPNAVAIEGRLLRRMRSTARSALEGAGMQED